ncbi:hypothetical protein [uncultured Thiohalocapsa sp.]|uniref:hypothetical protein n=1 Tax=uncultured Thiohalocapsa sp. TaxID=768990 RepID=UPI0025F4DA81|nr:hypothetical protein [uncultured Thiohalocapsa sp.]
MTLLRFSSGSQALRGVAAATLCVALLSTLPGIALGAASFNALGFASLTVIPGAGVIPLGGSIDDDTADSITIGNASAQVIADTVLAFDDFTLQDAGVSGEALPSATGVSSAFAAVSSSTSLTFRNTGPEIANLDYLFDYSADVFALLDDPTFDAVGASAQVLFGTIDFGTGLQTTLVDELLELVTAGTDGAFDSLQGNTTVAPGAAVGFFVDVAVDGFALSTELDEPTGAPVPATLALLGGGLLGLTLVRRGRRRAAPGPV